MNVQIHLGQRSERRERLGTEGGNVTVNNGGERVRAHDGVGSAGCVYEF